MESTILQLAAAFGGSLGYALLFHLRKSLIFSVSFNGMLTWGIYLFCEALGLGGGVFLSSLIASAFNAVYAEILARIKKAPATIFYIPAIMPMIPGGSLFYTMEAAVQGNFTAFQSYGLRTAQYALGIAAGMSLVWACSYMIRKLSKKV